MQGSLGSRVNPQQPGGVSERHTSPTSTCQPTLVRRAGGSTAMRTHCTCKQASGSTAMSSASLRTGGGDENPIGRAKWRDGEVQHLRPCLRRCRVRQPR
jgi:hypothetical protein